MSTMTLPATGQQVRVEAPSDNSGKVQVVKVAFGVDEDTNLRVSSANPLPVTLPGVYAEDSPSNDGDKGLLLLVVRRDTPSSGVSANSDYAALSVDSSGNLRTALSTGANALAISASGAADTTSLPRIRPTPSASFVSPSSAAYAALDAVSDNATAGSVTPLSFQVADQVNAPVFVLGGTVFVNDLAVLNKSFRLYLFNGATPPQTSSGDNAPWSQTMAQGASIVGSMTVTFTSTYQFSDGCMGFLKPESDNFVPCLPASGTQLIYGLFQTVDGYTPTASGKTFTFVLYAQQCR